MAPKNIQNHPKTRFGTVVRTVNIFILNTVNDHLRQCLTRAEIRQRLLRLSSLHGHCGNVSLGSGRVCSASF